MFICLFSGSRVTTDQRVVAKQEIQEVDKACLLLYPLPVQRQPKAAPPGRGVFEVRVGVRG
jgi:hypothetical protein